MTTVLINALATKWHKYDKQNSINTQKEVQVAVDVMRSKC